MDNALSSIDSLNEYFNTNLGAEVIIRDENGIEVRGKLTSLNFTYNTSDTLNDIAKDFIHTRHMPLTADLSVGITDIIDHKNPEETNLRIGSRKKV